MIGVRRMSMPRHRWLSVTVPVCELQQSCVNAVAATQPSDARCWKVLKAYRRKGDQALCQSSRSNQYACSLYIPEGSLSSINVQARF